MTRRRHRPRLNVPRTGAERLIEAVALVGLVFTVAIVALNWSALPETIPQHFDASGEPDAWGGRTFILFPAGMVVVLYVGLSLLQRYPHSYNYPWAITDENAPAQYQLGRQLIVETKAIMTWTFGWITYATVQTALGVSTGLGAAFLPVLFIALIGSIGSYFVRASRAR